MEKGSVRLDKGYTNVSDLLIDDSDNYIPFVEGQLTKKDNKGKFAVAISTNEQIKKIEKTSTADVNVMDDDSVEEVTSVWSYLLGGGSDRLETVALVVFLFTSLFFGVQMCLFVARYLGLWGA